MRWLRCGVRVLAAALACCALSCEQERAATQVMVVIDAELEVRARIHDVDIEVRSGEGSIAGWTTRFSGSLTQGSSAIAWPLEVALRPREDGLDRSYLVVVTARGVSGGAIAQMRAISGYLPGKSLSLPLLFDAGCLGRSELCSEELTCMAGLCVDPRVPVSSLLPFDENRPNATPVMPGGGAGVSGAEGSAGTTAGMDGASGAGGATTPPSCEATQQGCVIPPPVDCPDDLCGDCPDGFVRAGDDACAPLLMKLLLSRGELVPALNASDTHYRIALPLLGSKLSLTPLVADGVRVELNGAEAEPGAEFELSDLPLGETTLVATLTHEGHTARTYTFTIARQGAQRAYLKASNSGANDGFGSSVAATSDTIVVGAPGEDSGADAVDGDAEDESARDSGAAYVFVRDGASFVQQAYLKPSTVAAGARFGQCVAISNDTIAVGAPSASGGAVYIFTRSGTRWQEQARLQATQPQSGGTFGSALALLGDTLIVGASTEDRGATDSGAVYTFTRSGGSWSRGVELRSPRPQSLGWFGSSVAFDGSTLVVGATGETQGDAIVSGAAYVYAAKDGGFEFRSRLFAEEGISADLFGESVAVDGDTLFVGAPWASPAVFGSGVVYVFTREGEGEFTRSARLVAGNETVDAFFGYRIALGPDTLVVGAADENTSARGINGDLTGSTLARSGAAYVFTRHGGAFTQLAHLKAELPGATDLYGGSVTLFGDAIVVGAQGEASAARGEGGATDDDSAPGSGAVYLVR